MNNLPKDELNNNYEDEMNLLELFNLLWSKVFYIGVITSIFSLISIVYALNVANIYQSHAELMPTEKNNGVGGMLGQYGGMASLAGISLQSDSGSKADEAIARIKSFEFFSKYFLPNIQLENLKAVKKWNQASNTLIYDERIFDSESGQWLQEAKTSKSRAPSLQQAYSKYRNILSIKEDALTTFVILSIEHESPFIAQKWTNIILDQIDQVMRDLDRQNAMNSVEYLNSLALSVNYEELRTAISSLQQEQMKRLMMVDVYQNYIFKVLESPIVPEMRVKPRRSVIVIISSLLGMILSIAGVLFFHHIKKSSRNISSK